MHSLPLLRSGGLILFIPEADGFFHSKSGTDQNPQELTCGLWPGLQGGTGSNWRTCGLAKLAEPTRLRQSVSKACEADCEAEYEAECEAEYEAECEAECEAEPGGAPPYSLRGLMKTP